jgi:hypothetical protein
MTNQPPNLPPPGWYDDPEGHPGLRWWDGTTWTQDRAPGPPPQGAVRTAGGLRDVGEWLGQSFGLVKERAGHLFTMVVALSLPSGLIVSYALWSTLRQVTVAFDETTFDYEGPSSGSLLFLSVAVLLSGFVGMALWAAMQRQTMAALLDRPEPWSKSLGDGIVRSPKLLGNYLLIVLVFAVVLVLATVLTALVPLLGIVAFVGVFVLGMMAIGRLLMFVPSATCSPAGTPTLKTTLALSKGFTWALIGRALLLLLILLGISIAASVVTAPLGASVSQDIDPNGDVIRFADLMGDNFPQFALVQVVSTLVNAIGIAVGAAATSILYKDRNGPLDPTIGVDSLPSS